jgi:hypothetical protein
MRKLIAAAMLVGLSAPALASGPGTAQQFLERADRLLHKGPFALFDSDYKRLQAEGTAAGNSIRADREAAERAGRPIAYCSPKPRAELGNMEFVSGLRAIPQAERERISLKQAMLIVLQKKYPCHR